MRSSGLMITLLALAGAANAQGVIAPSLEGEASLQMDAYGMPMVSASSPEDAAFVQGYAHARERLFQMDYSRRLASGTLAELLGSAALDSDIQLRTLGLRRAAQRSLGALSSETRAMLRAFSAGVNAYVASEPLPVEYGLLELTRVEPWRPVDSVAIAKLLAFGLSFDLEDIDRTVTLGTYQAVGQAAGFDGTALFFEDTHRSQPPDGRVTVPGFLGGLLSAKAERRGVAKYEAVDLALSRHYLKQIEGIPVLQAARKRSEHIQGSNWWIASGDLTPDGKPLLAHDPHLSLDIPSTFMPMHVNDGGSNAAGVTFPGVPGVVLGCNDDVCWGATVHPMDVTDAFMEEVRTNVLSFPTHTVHDGKAEPIRWIFQSYFVNTPGDGAADNLERANVGFDNGAVTFVVPRRNDGPIVSLDLDNGRAISVQYTGWGATREIEAFLDFNRAASIDEFRAGLEKFDFGSQNFGVIDSSGNIAYFASGEMPLREDLQTLMTADGGIPPWLIRDGTGALKHEWMPLDVPPPGQATPAQILPAEELPHEVNPERGWIVNANNDPVGTTLDNNPLNQLRPGGGLYYLNPGYASYRMGRIDRLMSDAAADGGVDMGDFMSFQGNNQMLDAELVLPHLIQAYENATAAGAWEGLASRADSGMVQEVMALFMDWDYSSPTGIVEGYDPGDADPFLPSAPDDAERRASAAATFWAGFRSHFVRRTIDGTLLSAGIPEDALPGSRLAYNAAKYLLDSFDTSQGFGASGLDFFAMADAPTREAARDARLLQSLVDAIEMFGSEEFDAAFGGSEDPLDYAFGKLHRLELDHPFVPQFDLPTEDGTYGLRRYKGLPGVPRAGGYEVLDASTHSVRADGLNEFMFGSGPARRFVGAIAPDGVDAWQVFPGGTSGSFGDADYAQQFYLWLINAYAPLIVDADAARSGAVETLSFGPGG